MFVAKDARAQYISLAVGLSPRRRLAPKANSPFLPIGCLSFSFIRMSAEFLASNVRLVRALIALLRQPLSTSLQALLVRVSFQLFKQPRCSQASSVSTYISGGSLKSRYCYNVYLTLNASNQMLRVRLTFSKSRKSSRCLSIGRRLYLDTHLTAASIKQEAQLLQKV